MLFTGELHPIELKNNRMVKNIALILIALFLIITLLTYAISLGLFFHASELGVNHYYHVIEQTKWIAKFADDKVEFEADNNPRIFYDRVKLYHPTTPDGCRYKCDFINELDSLRHGDIAVFSSSYESKVVSKIKERGVLIAFESGESPQHMPFIGQELLNLVDLFITVEPESIVPYVYPLFVKSTHPEIGFTPDEKVAMLSKDHIHLLPDYHQQRRKNSVAWVCSNFSPKNNRIDFAYAISNFMNVDIYGKNHWPMPAGDDPFEYISRKYKFYLAFENSNCRHYVTEKATFNALFHDMIPIVLGAYKEDYEAVMPPFSYINVDDFKSIRELTDYIKYLDSNDTAYARYLAWKEYGTIVDPIRLDCRLCGVMYQLKQGKLKLSKPNPSDYVDPATLCFDRPLLPIERRVDFGVWLT